MTISTPMPPRADKAMTQEGVPLLPGDGTTDEGAGVGVGAGAGLGGDGGRSRIEKDADVVAVLILAATGA